LRLSDDASREAAKERSLRRDPLVESGNDQAPKERKNSCHTACITLRSNRLPLQTCQVLARKIRVKLSLRPIVEAPFQVVLNVLREAIDADDDILTRWTEAHNLKESAQKASTFQTLVNILKDQRAI
jgi:hypothetical protein